METELKHYFFYYKNMLVVDECLWYVISYSPVETHSYFGGTLYLHLQDHRLCRARHPPDVIRFSQTSVNNYRTTRCHSQKTVLSTVTAIRISDAVPLSPKSDFIFNKHRLLLHSSDPKSSYDKYTKVRQNKGNTVHISLLIWCWTIFCLQYSPSPSWTELLQVLNSL
jgi:hypothetical protein